MLAFTSGRNMRAMGTVMHAGLNMLIWCVSMVWDSEQGVHKWQGCLLAMVLNILTVLTILIVLITNKTECNPHGLKIQS